MRLYNLLNPLAQNTTAGKKNKGVFFVNSSTTDSSVNITVKNNNGSTVVLEFVVNGTSDVTSFIGPVNYFIFPFNIQSWSLTGGSINAYELY
jgi:hypothetical protein